MKRRTWLQKRDAMGLDYPNLPYFIDGDKRITQSGAIMFYLARKHGLLGATLEEKTRATMAYFELCDFRFAFYFATYGLWYEWVPESARLLGWTEVKKYDWYSKHLPSFLRRSSDFLGDRNFMAGEEVTFVDFLAYELLDVIQYTDPACLANATPNLWKYYHRMESMNAVQNHRHSHRHISWPVNCNHASFGYKAEDKHVRDSVDLPDPS
ncbi:unnamed protein product [Notodromas monacha]|uniref:glutathione transferase n=1 Tax=Notodromas monacha TaxID=399045 RepID=A0A7R9C2U9_9CRUS|nr:unnamed protein product [Notodromas monacha]CAG0924753.1 unnamed protein product [Notodromas monacha]